MTERRTTLEERRVLNAAFSAALIARASLGFQQEAKVGLPFVYAYLVLPMVLHTETRQRLPGNVVTRLINWAERNPDIMTTFLRRFVELRHVSREGLLLLTTIGSGTFSAGGRIEAPQLAKSLNKAEKSSGSGEVAECLKKSFFLGRWLAVSGEPSIVLTALGVRL